MKLLRLLLVAVLFVGLAGLPMGCGQKDDGKTGTQQVEGKAKGDAGSATKTPADTDTEEEEEPTDEE